MMKVDSINKEFIHQVVESILDMITFLMSDM